MSKIPYNNIPETKIDDNMYNNNIKNINFMERILNDKLNEIKEQIKTLNKNNIEYNSEKNIKKELDLKLRKEEEINLIKRRKYENKKIFEDTKKDKKIKDNNNIIL